MTQVSFSWLLFGFFLIFEGCSHAPIQEGAKPEPSLRVLLTQACSPGKHVRSAKGSVWLKAHSKEASGQFPAVVDAPNAEHLKMEITNLVGGTEAVISVDGRHYKIEVPHHKEKSEQGEASWGGIPLQWANSLFLGRIPCPDPSAIEDSGLSVGKDGELMIQTSATLDRQAEKFVFRFKKIEGISWPESLHWEKLNLGNTRPVSVDFKFEDPEAKTLSPKKWEAKGAQGEVKVRWRDRQIEMLP
ncbi:hypothetical protein WDW37_04940 [Bdellovibrionota bacterium FG-1]